MNEILLTGSNGFVGGYLKSKLNGKKLQKYDRSNKNLTQWENLEGIIHCAGLAHNSHNISLKHLYFEANVCLTKQLISNFNNSNCKYFIFLSTSKIYEGLNNGTTITESQIGNKLSIYAKSKLEAEKIIINESVANKKIFILRPSVIVGPNPKGNIRLLELLVRSKLPILIPKKTSKNNLTDIRNIYHVIQYLIDNHDNVPSGIYNVRDNKKPDFPNLLKNISNHLNKRCPRFILLPKRVFTSVLKVLSLLNREKYEKMMDMLFNDQDLSITKITKYISLPFNSFK